MKYTKCPICNRKLKQITNSHVNSHKLTMSDFKVKFPNVPLTTENHNKHRRYNLSGIKKHSQQIHNNHVKKYNLDPNFCKNCKTKIEYNLRQNNFCSSSCSASYNNKIRNPDKIRKYKSVVSRWGPYTKVKQQYCNMCDTFFWSHMKNTTYTTTCSSECWIKSKLKNAFGKKPKMYKDTLFDSNWEVMVAKELDSRNIEWIRPTIPILWLTRNKNNINTSQIFIYQNMMFISIQRIHLLLKNKKKN